MKRFKISYTDISESGYWSSGTTNYGIILAENADEARKIVAEKEVTDGMVLLHGADCRKHFGDSLTVIEIE